MGYEKRVGERIELGDMPVRFTHYPETQRRRRGRRRRSQAGVDPDRAYLRNVSASGAGVVAPLDETKLPGTPIEVDITSEASFVGRVRRVIPTSDGAWCYYGIEMTDQNAGYGDWLRALLDTRRDSVITESHWRSAF